MTRPLEFGKKSLFPKSKGRVTQGAEKKERKIKIEYIFNEVVMRMIFTIHTLYKIILFDKNTIHSTFYKLLDHSRGEPRRFEKKCFAPMVQEGTVFLRKTYRNHFPHRHIKDRFCRDLTHISWWDGSLTKNVFWKKIRSRLQEIRH